MFCVTQARSEDARSSPSQRRRAEDSTSTGELQPMPTSPGVDLRSPAAQDALFSSPPQIRPSGGFLKTKSHVLDYTADHVGSFDNVVDIMPKHSSCIGFFMKRAVD